MRTHPPSVFANEHSAWPPPFKPASVFHESVSFSLTHHAGEILGGQVAPRIASVCDSGTTRAVRLSFPSGSPDCGPLVVLMAVALLGMRRASAPVR
jgi:hypothetical protein